MNRGRAARVAVAVATMAGTLRGDALRHRVEGLLRDEFADERRQAGADRGDASWHEEPAVESAESVSERAEAALRRSEDEYWNEPM